jgi:hypothetical protein
MGQCNVLINSRNVTVATGRHLESAWFKPMVSLPTAIFDEMSSLTLSTSQCSCQWLLRSLTLAVFLVMDELPSFDQLVHLERLVISCVPMVHQLPDFAAIIALKAFVVFDRGEWCCNGFLSECDLQNPLCEPHLLWGFLLRLVCQRIARKTGRLQQRLQQ